MEVRRIPNPVVGGSSPPHPAISKKGNNMRMKEKRQLRQEEVKERETARKKLMDSLSDEGKQKLRVGLREKVKHGDLSLKEAKELILSRWGGSGYDNPRIVRWLLNRRTEASTVPQIEGDEKKKKRQTRKRKTRQKRNK